MITERNFAEDNTKDTFDTNDANVAYTAVNSKGKAVEVADYDAAIREEWTNKGNVSTEDNRFVYELSLPTISVDANYDFAYDYTDLAGNPINEIIKQAVTLDRVKPEGTVTVEDLVNGSASETWNKFLSAITFGHFGKNSVRASMTSDDETAGVAATQYLTSAKALTRSELEARTDGPVTAARSAWQQARTWLYMKRSQIKQEISSTSVLTESSLIMWHR